jgi:hypothetical protein
MGAKEADHGILRWPLQKIVVRQSEYRASLLKKSRRGNRSIVLASSKNRSMAIGVSCWPNKNCSAAIGVLRRPLQKLRQGNWSIVPVISKNCGAAIGVLRRPLQKLRKAWVSKDRGQAWMRSKQQRIVAEDGGTHECVAKQGQIIAEDRGTRECMAEQWQSVMQDGASANARPNRGNALARLMVAAQESNNPVEDEWVRLWYCAQWWRDALMLHLMVAQCFNFAPDGGAMLQFCAWWPGDASILCLMAVRCFNFAPDGGAMLQFCAWWRRNAWGKARLWACSQKWAWWAMGWQGWVQTLHGAPLKRGLTGNCELKINLI